MFLMWNYFHANFSWFLYKYEGKVYKLFGYYKKRSYFKIFKGFRRFRKFSIYIAILLIFNIIT